MEVFDILREIHPERLQRLVGPAFSEKSVGPKIHNVHGCCILVNLIGLLDCRPCPSCEPHISDWFAP